MEHRPSRFVHWVDSQGNNGIVMKNKKDLFVQLYRYTVCRKVCTLRLKSLCPLGSVWGKTTLNTGSVGTAGADPQT